MSEQTRIKYISITLAAAVIWAGFNYKSDDKQHTEKAPQTILPLDTGIIAAKNSSSFINIEQYEKEPWGRSPFYLYSLSTVDEFHIIPHEKILSWVLSGIVFNNSSPTAIINKRPVKIGDSINKAIVTQIEKEKVIIKYNQEEIILTVSKG